MSLVTKLHTQHTLDTFKNVDFIVGKVFLNKADFKKEEEPRKLADSSAVQGKL